jgi:hypothetical protein
MRRFAEREKQFRCIEEYVDSSWLNWKEDPGKKGTASLIGRTRKICKKMEVELKLNKEEGFMIVKSGKRELKTKRAVRIGRFLTQSQEKEKVIQYEGHGSSFTTLKKNEVSNVMLRNIFTRRSDGFFLLVDA